MKSIFNKIKYCYLSKLTDPQIRKIANPLESGQVLFEILLAMAVIVSLVVVSSEMTQVSLQSAKTAGERTIAINLTREAFEATRAISSENWVNFYNLTKGNQYYPAIQTGKWVLVSGQESVSMNGEIFARYLVVDNVSRDPATGDIETIYNSANEDPSTQKITVTIQKSTLPTISYSEYISRWKNASPVQTGWQSGGGQGDNPTSGDSTNFNNNYSSDDGNVDTTGTSGSLKLKTQ